MIHWAMIFLIISVLSGLVCLTILDYHIVRGDSKGRSRSYAFKMVLLSGILTGIFFALAFLFKN